MLVVFEVDLSREIQFLRAFSSCDFILYNVNVCESNVLEDKAPKGNDAQQQTCWRGFFVVLMQFPFGAIPLNACVSHTFGEL